MNVHSHLLFLDFCQAALSRLGVAILRRIRNPVLFRAAAGVSKYLRNAMSGSGADSPAIDKHPASIAFSAVMANSDNETLVRARLFQSSNPEIGRRLAAVRLRGRTVGSGEMVF